LVKVDGMRLSVRAQRVPLAKILEEVRREGRIEIHLDERIGHSPGALVEKDSSEVVRERAQSLLEGREE